MPSGLAIPLDGISMVSAIGWVYVQSLQASGFGEVGVVCVRFEEFGGVCCVFEGEVGGEIVETACLFVRTDNFGTLVTHGCFSVHFTIMCIAYRSNRGKYAFCGLGRCG